MLGNFRIGEDITIALDAMSGDVADIATITASLRKSVLPHTFQVDATFSPIALAVSPRAAVGDFPVGWNITLTAVQSAALEPGLYGIDAKLTGTSGSIDITDTTAVIEITRAAIQ